MNFEKTRVRYRREFLQFLAASPLMAYGLGEAWAQGTPSAAKDVLSVMDFEALARAALPPAHFGYMASGVDDDLTLQANVSAFRNIELRPRRLVDVSKTDIGVELFGQRFATPIFVALVFIAAIAIAFLSTRFGFEADWSHANGASVGDASRTLLQTLDAPVEVVSYASRQNGLRAVIADFVERYRRVKPDITLRFVDPDTDPEAMRAAGVSVDGELDIRFKTERKKSVVRRCR